jgi:hypothetical protein
VRGVAASMARRPAGLKAAGALAERQAHD